MTSPRLIISDSTDVYFNLALEDYLLHHGNRNVFMLWRSHGAVVCGKHQNICAEVNYGFCRQHNIAVARRLSGGGTVFHDQGNVNFSFIHQLEEGLDYAVNFRRFLDPVIAALRELGVEASYSGRNDLLVDGKKISGNAEHVFQKQKRVLHHGTLLFDTQLAHLRDALHSEGVYEDKAVKSVRSEVTNLKPYLPHIPATEEFIQGLATYFISKADYLSEPVTKEEADAAVGMAVSKYSTDEWLLGYSPKYNVTKDFSLNGELCELHMRVEKGVIIALDLKQQGESIHADVTEQFEGMVLSENTAEKFIKALFADPDESLRYKLF